MGEETCPTRRVWVGGETAPLSLESTRVKTSQSQLANVMRKGAGAGHSDDLVKSHGGKGSGGLGLGLNTLWNHKKQKSYICMYMKEDWEEGKRETRMEKEYTFEFITLIRHMWFGW